MLLNTANFGELEVKEEDLLYFDEGLPGFESMERFVIIDNEEESSMFGWLQSVDDSKLAFVIINPIHFRKDYIVTIDDLTVSSLEIEAAQDVAIYSIVVVPEDISKISANLKAPLIINKKNNKGKQVILDNGEYHVRHYILEELQKRGD